MAFQLVYAIRSIPRKERTAWNISARQRLRVRVARVRSELNKVRGSVRPRFNDSILRTGWQPGFAGIVGRCFG